MKGPVVSFGVSMGLAWLWAACLLMYIQGYVAGELACYVLLWNLLALALELVGSWVELGFNVGMEAFG